MLRICLRVSICRMYTVTAEVCSGQCPGRNIICLPVRYQSKNETPVFPICRNLVSEFGAHPDAISVIGLGSCYCPSEPLNVQMLEILRWALACASIQTEPLIATLLLPNGLNSAFTSLHLTTVQNMSLLNPTSWTGQSDQTKTFRLVQTPFNGSIRKAMTQNTI